MIYIKNKCSDLTKNTCINRVIIRFGSERLLTLAIRSIGNALLVTNKTDTIVKNKVKLGRTDLDQFGGRQYVRHKLTLSQKFHSCNHDNKTVCPKRFPP